MIKFAPMWAVVLRHTRMWKRDINILLFSLYWPILDILTWGFLGAWIAQSQVDKFQNYEVVALLGNLLWQVVGRGCNAIIMALTEEMYSGNVINIFSLPIRMIEWIAGVICFFAIMISIIIAVSMLVILVFYDVSLGYTLLTFLIFFPPLFLSCIWLGFTALQFIIIIGKRGVEIGFIIAWFLLPFSGAYYPIEVLPAWGQTLSSWLPMSYVFKGLREYVTHQQDPTSYLIKGYVLSGFYASIAVVLFIYCFNRSKNNGLARLTD